MILQFEHAEIADFEVQDSSDKVRAWPVIASTRPFTILGLWRLLGGFWGGGTFPLMIPAFFGNLPAEISFYSIQRKHDHLKLAKNEQKCMQIG